MFGLITQLAKTLKLMGSGFAITNSGTLEATGSGGLIIESGVDNSGNLWANDGNIEKMGTDLKSVPIFEICPHFPRVAMNGKWI